MPDIEELIELSAMPYVYDIAMSEDMEQFSLCMHPAAWDVVSHDTDRLTALASRLGAETVLGTFRADKQAFGLGGVMSPTSDWTSSGCPTFFAGLSQFDNDATAITQLVATVSVVTRYFQTVNPMIFQTSDNRQQLLSIDSRIEMNLGGFNMIIEFSPAVRTWADDNLEHYVEVVVESMRRVCRLGFQELALRSVSVYDQSPYGWVLVVPGNAADIVARPKNWKGSPINGLHGVTDNLDGPVQQLAILAGVATIVRLVRESEASKEI